MEPLSPMHPTSPPTSEERKGVHRETSVVELPAATHAVGQDDEPAPPKPGDRGDRTDASPSAAAQPAPAPPAISTSTSTPQLLSPAALLLPPVPHHPSPTQTEADDHPIRQRPSIHAAAGPGTRDDDDDAAIAVPQRQDEPSTETGSARKDDDRMTEVKEGDKGMWYILRP